MRAVFAECTGPLNWTANLLLPDRRDCCRWSETCRHIDKHNVVGPVFVITVAVLACIFWVPTVATGPFKSWGNTVVVLSQFTLLA